MYFVPAFFFFFPETPNQSKRAPALSEAVRAEAVSLVWYFHPG